ncbi:hypothetical protein COU62_01890 [Candidatus Pacearchaeota archaeon CG10_big_fil_rev_8_21_14_0_10_35_219]|nr:hypothetical protein [Candidatus Pacearchaeota archaeon]OIO42544.1 MAG: hypothetical protein AUJ63_02570 [Candidatus Pacearchaeota archaeon CG1_02_35_32]PIO07943.1 MAG: hypothetical protein COU62_01890 [Candidatus Pacearchaeota archaeon CG10_big_fil_rev_8_21_14_0_10_35_219]PIY81398.1 MAG: hypothetical protein COY79_02700 [Candidatus Pacearchaeota archaeon CG_4_10_14_0_8_um_filter_35_169]PIZ80638.1 MAG: hypothetical protein COY00_00745 [Candidatus Pacearchaeota archaeon CG_4_10_14_0_2_um_filt
MKTIKVKNKYQTYTYKLTEPVGKNFNSEFKPELSPKQMLKLGVFGGDYFLGKNYKEFPKDWFKNSWLSPSGKNPEYNYFKISASQPLSAWKKKGWIRKQDPFGWFHWYCRYYLGRRSEDDERQIKRWKAIFRHVAQIKKNCKPKDLKCRLKQRQAVLHWAYDSRKL